MLIGDRIAGAVFGGAGDVGDPLAIEAMGTVFTYHLTGPCDRTEAIQRVATELERIEGRFSPFRAESELTRLNRGRVGAISVEMEEIIWLCERAKEATFGYFDPWGGAAGFDPSGLVKGYAVEKTLELLLSMGFEEVVANGGGDIALSTAAREPVGIRHPFLGDSLCAVVLCDTAVASSGLYERGMHIYNPFGAGLGAVAATVVGSPLWLGDAMATALVAAGPRLLTALGVGFEGFVVDSSGEMTFTRKFPFAAGVDGKAGGA